MFGVVAIVAVDFELALVVVLVASGNFDFDSARPANFGLVVLAATDSVVPDRFGLAVLAGIVGIVVSIHVIDPIKLGIFFLKMIHSQST